MNAHDKTLVAPARSRMAGLLARDPRSDLAHVLGVLRRRWPVLVAAIILMLALAGAALVFLTPYYTSRTSVLLDPKRASSLDLNALVAGVPIDIGFVESEVAVISSFSIARRVVEKLSLDQDAEYGPQAQGAIARLLGSVRGLFRSAGPSAEVEALKLSPAVRAAVDKLRTDMVVRRNGLTYVIDIAVTSKDPVKAATIGNAIAEAYLVDRLEARYAAAQRATGWLNDRLAGLKQAVEQSERAAVEYRTQNGLVSSTSGTVDKQQITEVNAQLTQARVKTAETRAKLEQARRVQSGGGSIASLGDVLASPLISSLRTQEAEVARREADLSTRYGASHPQVANVRAELSDIRRGISNEVNRIVSNLRNEYDVAQKREKSLQESLERVSGNAGQSDAAAIKLRELEREADSNRALYENFLAKFKEAREQTTLETTESRVITPAVAPREASFPRRGPVFTIAIVLGLFLGVGVAFSLESLASGFQTSEQAEDTLGCPTLAFLPKVTRDQVDPATGDLGIVAHIVAKPFSRFAEGVRTIRTGVLLSNLDQPPRVLMCVSTVPGEGKSTLAGSLAASGAQAGKKVLLIDGDLRNPSTSNRFNLGKRPGLVELLSGTASVSETFVAPGNMPFTILPAGHHTTNPTDVVASQKMAQMLRSLSQEFDLIIIDCPPLLAVSDGLLLANVVDSIVYVVEWNRTAREAVKRAMNMLDYNRDKVAGVVLNKVDAGRMRTYSYYGEYYGYGYDKYYAKS